MHSSRLTALVGALAVVLIASHAGAQARAPQPPPGLVLAPGERRPVPNYDGLPEPPPSVGELALWIPRVLLAPVWFVTEYLVRRPLGWLFHALEQAGVLEALPDVFTFFPDRRAGILPTALFEFGFQPSVGIYAFWNHFLLENNRISLHASTWGSDWLMVTVTDQLQPTEGVLASTRFSAVRRPDMLFGGIGWDATRLEPARFALDHIDGSLGLGLRPWRRSAIDYVVGYRSASFESNAFDADPGIAERGPLPAGFLGGYSAFRLGGRATLDTRAVRELSTGGVVASGHLEHHAAFGGFPFTRWLQWGGSLVLAAEVVGPGRVLALGAQAGFVSPLDDAQAVPFTELLELGGNAGPMRGFRPGIVRGYSVVAAGLTYVWPIWVLLDASLRVTVGNAFGRHLEDFAFDRLRLAVDLGVRPRTSGEHLLELLLGLGTETFGQGTSIVSVRLAVGARSGLW
jgi:hypothetical protein